MTIDYNLTFDYLNPDFSIVKSKGITYAKILPEHVFYFKHRIIHWLNQVNDKFDPSLNFESIQLEKYAINKNRHMMATYTFKNRYGRLTFVYKNESFLRIEFETEAGCYDNNNFPNSSHFFALTIPINEENEIDGYYLINRTIDIYKDEQYGFILRYDFYTNKDKDRLSLFDCLNQESVIIDIDNGFKFSSFDDFFNTNINEILKSPEAFIMIYPYFSITHVNSPETLEIFYKELKESYNKGIFDNGLADNLQVVKMAGI